MLLPAFARRRLLARSGVPGAIALISGAHRCFSSSVWLSSAVPSGTCFAARAPDAFFRPRSAAARAPTWLAPAPEDTEALGFALGRLMRAGDTVLLKGKLGVGKTQFARGFVRGASGDASLDVTSPTFLLDNSYPTAAGAAHGPGAGAGAVQVHHMDLYRLRSAGEAALLGIPHVFRADICIVEWPQRLQRLETREAAAAAAAAAEPLAEGATSADGARLSDSNGHSSAAPSHSGNSSSGSSLLPAEHLLVEIVAEDDVAFPRELLPALASHSLHALHVPVPAQAPIATAASTAPGAPATEAAADAAAAAAAIEVEEDTFSRAIVMVAAGPRMAAVLAQLELAMPGSGFQAGHGHGAQGQGSWEVHHEHGTGHGPAPRDGSGNSGQASGGGWPLR